MLKTGLVSITFRKLSPGKIIELVARAGLDGIEWGGDVHVPHGDAATAADVAAKTRTAGLSVASYGSYYRAGAENEFSFDDVLACAKALRSPVVRVWAGRGGSADASADIRERVADDTRRIADQAAAAGIRIAFEFHANTLTDTTESALQLLRAARHPNVYSYWQPPVGWSEKELADSLSRIAPHLEHLHVFQWGDDHSRQPLGEGRERWTRLFRLAEKQAPAADRYAMLEFVRSDDPAAFLEDARVLLELVSPSRSRHRGGI
jgi:sugar phosphate isomerase/epimerase